MESHFQYTPIHEVVRGLDPVVCKILPVFHTFTGCDTVSAFRGRGKKTAWNAFLMSLKHLLMEDSNSELSLLEQFVVLLQSSK